MTRTEHADRAVAAGAAAALAVLGFLPIANWVAGGPAAPWFDAAVANWVSGAALTAAVAALLVVLARRVPALWPASAASRALAAASRRPAALAAAAGALALGLSALVAWRVFGGRPLTIDEITQLLQAQIFAEGRLTRPVDAEPAFFSSLHVVDRGRFFGQFPPGGPAFLWIGLTLGAPWLVAPLCAGVGAAAFAAYVRAIDGRASVRVVAPLLLAVTPFFVFMAGSHMNHVPTVMCLLVAIACMAHGLAATAPRPGLAFAAGVAFGAAAAIRPVDAFAFALPAGAWYLWRATRLPGRWRDAAAAAAGVALPAAAVLWFNAQTTGSPLLFGYAFQWGDLQALGFHGTPWGDEAHTPVRGLELLNLYALRLQSYLFDAALPGLLPAFAALALTRRLGAHDRYLIVASTLLAGLYFAYWFDGFYLGPRFMLPLVPVLVLWTARLPAVVAGRFGTGLALRGTVYAALAAAAIGAVALVPARAAQYRVGLATTRWDADSAAAAAGVRGALVLVRESWGSQVLASLWSLGISRSAAEHVYRRVDTCLLDETQRRLAAAGVRGDAAHAALVPLMRDSALLRASPFSADTSERVLPGATYTRRCGERLRDDASGFTLFAPLLVRRGGGNLYARDLHERDTLLLARHPDRPVFLLKPADAAEGSLPRFFPVSRDSLWRAARGGP
ncbi:MAG TPA: hypothetical protein VNA89_00095 [Gemmatimonadaceae bacterium]|nr:hypothetical protein [Gemmatimonadaceae bacterium]